MMKMLPPHLRFDFRRAEEVIKEFIRKTVEASGASGVVIGLSGGSDSSVTAALAVRALGADRVKALRLPDRESSRESLEIAGKVADALGVEVVTIDITPMVESFLSALGLTYETAPKIVKGNIKVRSRMVTLYAFANRERRLVLGTSDRSEWLIGYFTKWGDGCADLYPIIGLYKTQVMEFGKWLGLPKESVTRPPTPDLWPGHTAYEELGVTYDLIDEVLYRVFDEGIPPERVSEVAGVPEEVVKRVMELHKASEHKRTPLKTPFKSFKEL
jgi:NAD+ synthase